MAHVDPARAVKRSAVDKRRLLQDQCRQVPCRNMEQGKPPCVVCVHEARVIEMLGER